ncbi:MAG TPA: anaerobic sulfite reductase subunit AsrA [Papillibacter sp.]|nr:anaerobic sulfite reductase subunit AsrA [Papillibacter sp.]
MEGGRAMEDMMSSLKDTYRLYAPKRFPDGSIRYGEIDSLSEIVVDEKSHFSPKEVYLPIVQTIFYFKDNQCEESEIEDGRDILIFARACDISAIERLDTIYLKNGGAQDFYYKRLRDKVKFVLIECPESFDSCFCVSMGASITDNFIGILRDGKIDTKSEPVFVSENKKSVTIPDIDESIVKDVIQLEYWRSFDENCAGCGGCTAVCPTCSCFDTIDVIYSETSLDGERRRVWGSCMQEDFSAMAGGHNVRKRVGDRMRFKVMHKIYDFHQRFGETHMCVGCGRCDERCPKDIVFSDIINTLAGKVEQLKAEGGAGR